MSFDSYIKPQHKAERFDIVRVVCLLIPTSNHNDMADLWVYGELYVF